MLIVNSYGEARSLGRYVSEADDRHAYGEARHCYSPGVWVLSLRHDAPLTSKQLLKAAQYKGLIWDDTGEDAYYRLPYNKKKGVA